jgi:hypothetical protein
MSVIPRHDGSFIVSGADADESTNTIRLAAYAADGSVLEDFGNHGRLDTGLSILEDDYPLDDYLAIDGADRLVVVGQNKAGALTLLRILPDGSLDRPFSAGATPVLQEHMAEIPTLDVSESGDVFLLQRDASGLLKIKSEPGPDEETPASSGCAAPLPHDDWVDYPSDLSQRYAIFPLTNDFFPEGYTGERRITAIRVEVPNSNYEGRTVTVSEDGKSVLFQATQYAGKDYFDYQVDGLNWARVLRRLFRRRNSTIRFGLEWHYRMASGQIVSKR